MSACVLPSHTWRVFYATCCDPSLSVRMLFFFFSSRRRHTRSLCDWSSDVCSSDLLVLDLIKEGILQAKQMLPLGKRTLALFYAADFADQLEHKIIPALEAGEIVRSEERRVGKECRSRWSKSMYKKREGRVSTGWMP